MGKGGKGKALIFFLYPFPFSHLLLSPKFSHCRAFLLRVFAGAQFG